MWVKKKKERKKTLHLYQRKKIFVVNEYGAAAQKAPKNICGGRSKGPIHRIPAC